MSRTGLNVALGTSRLIELVLINSSSVAPVAPVAHVPNYYKFYSSDSSGSTSIKFLVVPNVHVYVYLILDDAFFGSRGEIIEIVPL